MASIAEQMLGAHPAAGSGAGLRALVECLDACAECVTACTMCADACLAEPGVAELTRCIRLDLDCADLCATTAAVLSRRSGNEDGHGAGGALRALLEACRLACQACAAECESHAGHHEHCRLCAEACRRCAAACEALLTSLD